MSPPAATSGAVMVRNASPAPTVSTTVLVKAGTRETPVFTENG